MFINVEYYLDDADFERLSRITDQLKKNELNDCITPDMLFEYIMTNNAKYEVDKKFKMEEWKLGLRDEF